MGRRNKIDIRKPEILEHFYQVLKTEGLEGASIFKIASHMGVHPSLLIHYFKTKEEMTVELVDFLLRQHVGAFFLTWDEIESDEQRLSTILDTIFGVGWAELFDNSVFYALYYLSFRNKRVHEIFGTLYTYFRGYLVRTLEKCIANGLIKKIDADTFADILISLVEGLDFYKNIRDDDQRIECIGLYLKDMVLLFLKNAPSEDHNTTATFQFAPEKGG
jgi:AcrR family transcriptional regulator